MWIKEIKNRSGCRLLKASILNGPKGKATGGWRGAAGGREPRGKDLPQHVPLHVATTRVDATAPRIRTSTTIEIKISSS